MEGLFQFQKCMNYLTKIRDILDNAMSNWVCNTVHRLAYNFNSASRQQTEVWALHLPFLHNC